MIAYTAKDVCATLELNATDTAAEDTNLTNVTNPEDTNVASVTNHTKQGGGKSMVSMHESPMQSACSYNCFLKYMADFNVINEIV